MSINHRAIVFLPQNIRSNMRTDRNHPVGEWMIEPLAKRRFRLQGNLSYDRQVDCLITDGKAFIDTGIKVGPNVTFSLEFYLPQMDNLIQLFGGREDAYNNQLYFYNDARDPSYPSYWRYGDKNVGTAQLTEGTYVFDNTQSPNVLYINDVSYTAANPTFTQVNSNFYIFTLNTQADGTPHPATQNMAEGIAFHGGKIYVNGYLVRDYIPVVKDDVGYLYDNITKKLYGNANSQGAFTYTEITV